jgi:hypothetical protein
MARTIMGSVRPRIERAARAMHGSTAVRYRRDFAVERFLPSLDIKTASGAALFLE